MSEREVFMAAVSLTDPSRREAFLREACAGQEPLRQRIDALLRAHDAASSFLTTPAIEQALGTTKPDVSGTPPGHVNPADVTTEGDSDILEDPHADRTLTYLSPTDKPGALGRLGHYEVEVVLGRGGFGTVLRAFDERLHRTVAIKMLSPELAATSPPRKRFLREARAAAAIRHQNVVQIYAVEDLPIPYFVMECVPGQTLQQLLDAHGPLDVADVLSIGRQIAAGLAAAHVQGLVHRDIKPANILIEGGRTGLVRISDFGLARTADDASLTQSGTVAGTPLFMSPEQAVGRTIDQRSDLFSLGSVLYQMVTGHPPFRAGSMVAVLRRVVEDSPRPISETIPECPAWLSAIIAKLLAKSPDDRFQSAAEIADLLGRCLDDYRANRPVRLPAGIPPAPTALAAQELDVVAKADRPTTRRRVETSHRRSLLAAGVVCAVLALGVTEATGLTQFAATVIRLTTASGTLVIETDDPGIRVTIDGEEVQIRGAGVEQLTLKPGRYQVTASKDGQPVSQQLVTIAKGGREVVRVTLESSESVAGRAAASPQGVAAAERRVAEGALSKGAYVRLIIQGPGKYPEYREPKAVADFPAEPFDCDIISFAFGTELTDADLELLLDAKMLHRLELMRTNLTDAGLKTVSRMESLTYLNIGSTRITEAGLPALRRLHQLAYLNLFGLPVTAAGLRILEGLPLEHLDVGATKLTGHDWEVYALFPRLKTLSFQETGDFDDGDLADLAHLTQLERLHVGMTAVSNEGLGQLQSLSRLEYLFLGGNPQITDAAVAPLSQLASLRNLYLDRTSVTADGIDRLQRALPECRITWDEGVVEPASVSDRRAAEWALSIGVPVEVSVPGDRFRIAPGEPLPADTFKLLFADLRVPEVKDAGLAHFAGCRNLTSLLLVGENITDAGVAHFRACKGLQELYLHNTSMTDAGLSNFNGCRDLTHLNISSRGFTDAGLAVFRDCHVRNLDLTLTQVTDAGLRQFHRIELLAGLQLPHTAVTDEGLSHFKSCALLGSLNLKETAVTDAGLAHLQNCAQLANVVLENTAVGDAGLAALKHCHAISILVLNGTRVSDAGLSELMALNSLRDLQLRRTGVTAAKIEELHQALTACRIEWDGGVAEPMQLP